MAIGISWGDIRSKLKGLYKWAEIHNVQSDKRDVRISNLEANREAMRVYMEDNRELLNTINRKLDRVVNRG